MLQVQYCARIHLLKIHRVFAVFIRASSWDSRCRTNLFRCVRNGGLLLTHLFLRQVVDRFRFLRNQSNPFLRTVFQVLLCDALPAFIVSSGDGATGPLSPFLKEVVAAYKFLAATFSMEYLSNVSRKKLMKELIELSCPARFYPTSYCALPGNDVLSRGKIMIIPANTKTFFFCFFFQTS